MSKNPTQIEKILFSILFPYKDYSGCRHVCSHSSKNSWQHREQFPRNCSQLVSFKNEVKKPLQCHSHEACHPREGGDPQHWIPAFAGMIRVFPSNFENFWSTEGFNTCSRHLRTHIVLFLVVVFLATALPLYAQTSDDDVYVYDLLPSNEVVGDFVVSPGKVEVTLAPGASQTIELRIANRTGQTREYTLTSEDIAGSEDGEHAVMLLGESESSTIGAYLTLPTEAVSVPHGAVVRVPVMVTVPNGAAPGGVYGSVLVATGGGAAAPEYAAAASPLIARIGTLFFITVEGEAVEGGMLKDFSTIPPQQSVFSGGPLRFSLAYENTGSVHLNPYGEVRVTDMFGKEVAFMPLEPWFALPQSLRLREIEWDGGFLFGRYTVTANINRGYDDIVDTMSLHVFVIPWNIALVLFLTLFILFFIIRKILHPAHKDT